MRIAGASLAYGLVLVPCIVVAVLAAHAAGPEVPAILAPETIPRPEQATENGEAGLPQETLEDAWRIAAAADQRLQASMWNASSATRSLAAARAERLPSLAVGADYLVLSQEPGFSLPASPVLPSRLPFFEQTSGGVHAIATQPVYTSGRISSGINAAQAGLAANQAEVGRTRLDVKMTVAEAYVTVLRARRLVEVAENKATSLAAHSRDVRNLFDKGVVAKSDKLAAQVALADARQQLLQAHNGLEIAKASYNRALGRTLSEPVNLADLRDYSLEGDVEDFTSQALRCRPELAQLSAQARALQEQAAGVRAKKAPQVTVAGGYLYQQDKYIDPNGVAGVGVGVQWNVIDAGRTANQADALCQKAESLIRMRRDTESFIALEVRHRWLDLQTASQRIEVAQQSTAEADENLSFARQRYQQQTGTSTEVLDAETLRVQAHSNFYNSTYEAVLARLRLCRAIGSL
jgi:outer membrane protein